MKRFVAASLLVLSCIASVYATGIGGPGMKIKVKLENYTEKELLLGFHYGEKQYVKDTAVMDADGYFTFEADTVLAPGVYLLVMKPSNNYLQMLLPEDDQDFTITTDINDLVGKMKVKGSEDNAVFYDYLRFLNKYRPEADSLKAKITRARGNEADSVKYTRELEGLDKVVKKYQLDMIAKYPKSVCARMTKASLDPEIPEFDGKDEQEKARRRYYWIMAHYFDNIDIADPALLRSPVLHPKVHDYVTKYVPQHPDSVNIALDILFGKLQKNQDNYKYFLVHFLNHFAKAQVVGFDACYVHIALEYYCKGLAPWAKKEDIEKICDNARRLEPILIGKTAPNIVVYDRKGEPHALWDVNADYTVLFFWAPDCGHCKKAAPFMIEFAQKYKDKGVKVFAVCTAVAKTIEEKDGPECWKGVEEKGFTDDLFMNLVDPLLRSKYKTLYDVQSTPQIFILNREHKILMKRIGAEQLLENVMDEVMKAEEEKKKKK